VRVSVRAPATVANLGPGFDCLALALDLWNGFTVDTEAEPGVEVHGEGAEELADPGANLVLRALSAAGVDAGSLRLACVNRVPFMRGLGSSATAVVGGLLLADAVRGRTRPAEELLDDAVALEGHADNVAACLLGGLTLSYRTEAGWRAERLQPAAGLRPVALVPDGEHVSTERARRALPAEVPFDDAVFELSRAALAVVSLTARPDLLRDALEDRLHQAHRLALAPGAAAVFDRLRSAGVPVCVAGSGPALLAFEADGRTVPELGQGWRTLRPAVSAQGAELGWPLG